MRRLTLLRHGKSSWDNPGLDDHDRPLNERGTRDAKALGRCLKERGFRPQIILSSTALRARTTAALFATSLGLDPETIYATRDLYLASAKRIVKVADAMAPHTADILLVGHNPGMTTLANNASDVRLDNLPTCGIISIVGDTTDWQGLLHKPGRTDWCLLPKRDLQAH